MNYENKFTLLPPGRRGFLTAPTQSVKVIMGFTIKNGTGLCVLRSSFRQLKTHRCLHAVLPLYAAQVLGGPLASVQRSLGKRVGDRPHA